MTESVTLLLAIVDLIEAAYAYYKADQLRYSALRAGAR